MTFGFSGILGMLYRKIRDRKVIKKRERQLFNVVHFKVAEYWLGLRFIQKWSRKKCRNNFWIVHRTPLHNIFIPVLHFYNDSWIFCTVYTSSEFIDNSISLKGKLIREWETKYVRILSSCSISAILTHWSLLGVSVSRNC